MGRKRYVRSPPTGSVLATFVRILRFACKGRWSINPLRTWCNLKAPDFWDAVQPSRIPPASRPSWMTFDDNYLNEVRRGLRACAVFAWFPIYCASTINSDFGFADQRGRIGLTVNQLNSNLTSQAATLTTNGMPNDLLSNLDPLVLVFCIPFCDFFVCGLLFQHTSHHRPAPPRREITYKICSYTLPSSGAGSASPP
jgi:POT family proton-dependent oligopeptide transporter